jgi:hypothetical protein
VDVNTFLSHRRSLATPSGEINGARLFFPEERPEDLVPHLRRLWDR